MVLAIDVGNTQTVFGIYDRDRWVASFRYPTNGDTTEDELAGWLHAVLNAKGLSLKFDHVLLASVVPPMDRVFALLASKWLGCPLFQLNINTCGSLKVSYQPNTAVGADRLANAIGALSKFAPPIIVVDCGTATTFDVIDASGTYVGGAILPGLVVSAAALSSKAAKLPQVDLRPPQSAIGKSTSESLQAGLMIGYAGAVEKLVSEISTELRGKITVIGTGGLFPIIQDLCPSVSIYDEWLTLNGLLIAAQQAMAIGG